MALLLASALLTSGLLIGTPAAHSARATTACMGLHDLTAKTMAGDDLKLSELSGKKVVALNVASR